MMAAKRLRAFVALALVALVCMGAALVHPVAALAAGTPPQEVEVGGTDVTAGGYWANDGAGGLVPGDASHYNVHYDGAGTLTLREDAHGLYGTIQINEQDTDAMNLYARVQRGDVSQCSFGFDIKSEEFVENPDGSVRWIIKDVVLYEVSVCTFPAYAETSVEARKNDLDTIRRREGELWKTKMKERINKCRS